MNSNQENKPNLKALLGNEYYEELKTQGLYNKISTGGYMPPLYDWLKMVNPNYNWDWKFQRYVIGVLQDFADGKIKKLMVFAPPRSGKKIANSAPVLTNKGWKTHGTLDVGDYVYHPSGEAIKVLALSEESPVEYRLNFSTKESIDAHGEHEWLVHSMDKHKHWIRETKQLYNERVKSNIGKRGSRYYFHIDTIKPVEFEYKELEMHPYVLGAWLGDGTSDASCITHAESDTIYISKIVEYGYPISRINVHKTTGVHTTGFGNSGFIKHLHNINVFKNKHIPDIYKFSSVEQRKELIAGLIDTDGSVDKKGRVGISGVSKKLIDDTEEVLISLGQYPYRMERQPKLSTSGIQGKEIVYYVGFQPSIDFPTVLPRKKIKPKENIKRDRIAITNIEKRNDLEMGRCIQVDSPDGMYLVGKTLIPTHNSELVSVHFPVYLLERNPSQRVILGTYNQTLANKLSRKVRSLARTRIELDPERSAMEEWETKEGGGLRAVGVGAGVTGVGGNCLIGSTEVTTEDGRRNISDLNIGDLVLSFNHQYNVQEYKKIQAVKKTLTKELIQVETESGRVIYSTKEHLFYTWFYKYFEAEKLNNQIALYNQDNTPDKILRVQKFSLEKEVLVYDIQVEENHNFFAEDILVHNCIIIDDPVRSRKDANSPTVRRTTYDWFNDDLRTRLEPNGSICLMNTRWRENDLAGMILEEEKDWTVISLPALAEENDPLGRLPGEALNPERYTREALLEIKKVMGRSFYALYQQRPQEQEGEFFKASWFNKLDSLPELQDNESYEFIRFWDKAATLDGDYTVGSLIAKNRKTGYYYVVDVVRGKWLPHTRDAMILRTAQKDQELYGSVRIYHEEEPGSSGKDAARQTNQLLSGYSVKAIRSTGNKQLRSEPYQSQCEAGNVFIIKGSWNGDFLDEHSTFPTGTNDDIVDSCAGAFSQLSKGRGSISLGKSYKK